MNPFLNVNKVHYYVLDYLLKNPRKYIEVTQIVHLVSKHHKELCHRGIYESQQNIYSAIDYLVEHNVIERQEFTHPVTEHYKLTSNTFTITERYLSIRFKTFWVWHGMKYFCLG
jgi:hypothetical protein